MTVFKWTGLVLLCALPAWLGATIQLDLQTALQKNWIAVEVRGEGGYTGRSLRVKLTNQTKKTLKIRIRAGQLFHSADSTEQDLLVVREKVLTLEKLQSRIGRLYGRCTQAGHSSPLRGSRFDTGPLATGPLFRLAGFLHQNHLHDHESAQDAIWAITDGKRLENIRDERLARFVAELLGVPPPSYSVIHHSVDRPGQVAYREAPALLEGTLRFSSQNERTASLNLYNAAGELLHTFFPNKKYMKGRHRTRFQFEISGLPRGTYSVRLENAREVLAEMEVVF